MNWYLKIKFKITKINNMILSKQISFENENICIDPPLLAEINDFLNDDGTVEICCLRRFNTNKGRNPQIQKEVIAAKIYKSYKNDIIRDMSNIVKKNWDDYVFEQKILREKRKRIRNLKMKQNVSTITIDNEKYTFL